MPIQVLMPALSPTMEKGNLARWVKKEGDPVKAGDVIAEIETDKATMEVEAVDEGTLGKILVPEGTEDVAVNTPIATILAEGEKAEPSAAPAETACAAVRPDRSRRRSVSRARRRRRRSFRTFVPTHAGPIAREQSPVRTVLKSTGEVTARRQARHAGAAVLDFADRGRVW